MRWTVHRERTIYSSSWLDVGVIDVEVPGIGRIDHHVVRVPRPAAGVVVRDRGRWLLMWRHRIITDTWGWEIPAGRLEPGEDPVDAARRETLEETGWEPGDLQPLCAYHPTNGLSDQTFHLFACDTAVHRGPPSDPSESERIEWFDHDEVLDRVRAGEVTDGLSLCGLLYADRFG